MPRFRRLVVPDYPHHVTQRGVRRQKTFFDDDDYLRYLRLADGLQDGAAIEVLAYCLMPNHIHAVVIPRRTDSLAGFFGPLHKRYAQFTNLRYEWTGHLWQARFYSVPMSEQHTLAAMRYVELNPMRSGLVGKPEEWRWSSARANLGLVDDPLLRARPADVKVDNWHEYLARTECRMDVDRLRRQTETGRPSGDANFIDNLEAITGRRIRCRKRGRKKSGD